MIYQNTNWEKLIGMALVILSCVIMSLAIAGGYHIVWGRHDTSAEIYTLNQRVEVLQVAVQEKDEFIKQQKTAFRFEQLFMLAADQNDLMDFDELEGYLCERRGICLNKIKQLK